MTCFVLAMERCICPRTFRPSAKYVYPGQIQGSIQTKQCNNLYVFITFVHLGVNYVNDDNDVITDQTLTVGGTLEHNIATKRG